MAEANVTTLKGKCPACGGTLTVSNRGGKLSEPEPDEWYYNCGKCGAYGRLAAEG